MPIGRELTCAIAGATSNVDLLRMFAADVDLKLWEGMDTGSASVSEAAQLATKKMFDTNILPFATFPPDQVPQYESLIGFFSQNSFGLYKIGIPQTLVEIDEVTIGSVHAAIGIGSMIADDLLDRFHTKRCDVDTAADLAVYVLKHVKDIVQDCDGFTDVVIQDTFGTITSLHPNYVDDLEKWYWNFDDVFGDTLIQSISSPIEDAASSMHSQLLQIAKSKPERQRNLRVFRESKIQDNQ